MATRFLVQCPAFLLPSPRLEALFQNDTCTFFGASALRCFPAEELAADEWVCPTHEAIKVYAKTRDVHKALHVAKACWEEEQKKARAFKDTTLNAWHVYALFLGLSASTTQQQSSSIVLDRLEEFLTWRRKTRDQMIKPQQQHHVVDNQHEQEQAINLPTRDLFLYYRNLCVLLVWNDRRADALVLATEFLDMMASESKTKKQDANLLFFYVASYHPELCSESDIQLGKQCWQVSGKLHGTNHSTTLNIWQRVALCQALSLRNHHDYFRALESCQAAFRFDQTRDALVMFLHHAKARFEKQEVEYATRLLYECLAWIPHSAIKSNYFLFYCQYNLALGLLSSNQGYEALQMARACEETAEEISIVEFSADDLFLCKVLNAHCLEAIGRIEDAFWYLEGCWKSPSSFTIRQRLVFLQYLVEFLDRANFLPPFLVAGDTKFCHAGRDKVLSLCTTYASECEKEFIESDSTSFSARFLLVQCLMVLKPPLYESWAVQLADKLVLHPAARENGNQTELRKILFSIFVKQGRLDKAIEFFDIFAQAPEDVENFVHCLFPPRNRNSKAFGFNYTSSTNSIGSTPQCIEAWKVLALWKESCGCFQEAGEYMKEYIVQIIQTRRITTYLFDDIVRGALCLQKANLPLQKTNAQHAVDFLMVCFQECMLTFGSNSQETLRLEKAIFRTPELYDCAEACFLSLFTASFAECGRNDATTVALFECLRRAWKAPHLLCSISCKERVVRLATCFSYECEFFGLDHFQTQETQTHLIRELQHLASDDFFQVLHFTSFCLGEKGDDQAGKISLQHPFCVILQEDLALGTFVCAWPVCGHVFSYKGMCEFFGRTQTDKIQSRKQLEKPQTQLCPCCRTSLFRALEDCRPISATLEKK